MIVSSLSYSQLKVNNAYSPQQLVLQKLLGPGITVSNIVYKGDSTQRGFFDASNSNIGIDSGIILCTGNILEAIGPNNSAGGGAAPLVNNFKDPDLEAIVNVNSTGPFNYDSTYDVSSLEFDFTSLSDTLAFNFVFASEEFLEFVNFGVNDAFGFFLSGPGINGPFTNNAINLAKVPGTNTFISIDSVNNVVNSSYYVDNGDGSTAPQSTDSTVVQFDGFTTKIGIQTTIQCNQTYHIKLVVADVGDGIYNSAVFIEGNTFKAFASKPAISIIDDKDTICLGDSIFINVNTSSVRIKSFSPATLPTAPGIYKLTPTAYQTTYSMIFEDTTACGLIYEDTNYLEVIVRPPLVVDFTSDSICIGDSTNFLDLTTGHIRSATWWHGDGDTSFTIQNNFNHLYPNPGNYLCKLKVETSFFCYDSVTKPVYVKDRSIPDFDLLNTCQFDIFSPTNTSTFVSGNIANNGWIWRFGDGNSDTLFNSTNQYLTPGIFTVTLVSTTDEGCVDSISKPLIINPKPIASFIADTVCFGHPTNFIDQSTGIIVSYLWDTTAIPQIQNPSFLFPRDGSYNVIHTVVSDSGCIDDTAITTIVNSVPLADFTFSPTEIYIFDTDVCFTNNSTNSTNYLWDFGFAGTKGSSVLQDPCDITFPNDKPLVYPVKLYAINSFGCIDSITIDVEILGGYILYIPNAFTPNNDGVNDKFLPISEGIIDYKLQIFNRWGELIFETQDPNQAWDGKYKGEEIPIDIYTYKIFVRDFEGNPLIKFGHISVLR